MAPVLHLSGALFCRRANKEAQMIATRIFTHEGCCPADDDDAKIVFPNRPHRWNWSLLAIRDNWRSLFVG
jgi:hypothetical protein